MGPRAGLDGCEKSRPHRDFFFVLCLYFIRTPSYRLSSFCVFVPTVQHTQHKHSCLRRDSKPQSQQFRSPALLTRSKSLYQLRYRGPLSDTRSVHTRLSLNQLTPEHEDGRYHLTTQQFYVYVLSHCYWDYPTALNIAATCFGPSGSLPRSSV
jgi:hypothetical protein